LLPAKLGPLLESVSVTFQFFPSCCWEGDAAQLAARLQTILSILSQLLPGVLGYVDRPSLYAFQFFPSCCAFYDRLTIRQFVKPFNSFPVAART